MVWLIVVPALALLVLLLLRVKSLFCLRAAACFAEGDVADIYMSVRYYLFGGIIRGKAFIALHPLQKTSQISIELPKRARRAFSLRRKKEEAEANGGKTEKQKKGSASVNFLTVLRSGLLRSLETDWSMELTVGTGDAATTAQLCGALASAVRTVGPISLRYVTRQKQRAVIMPCFESAGVKFDIRCMITVRTVHIIRIALCLAGVGKGIKKR